MRTKWKWTVGLMAANMVFAGNAFAGIQVQVPAGFESGAQTQGRAKRGCDVEQAIAQQVFEKFSQKNAGVRARAVPDRDSEDPFLMLTILEAHGAGDTAWLNAKNTQVRADLLAKGRITASKVFNRHIKVDVLDGKADSCPNMEDSASAMGQEIAKWLPDAIKAIPAALATAPPAPSFTPMAPEAKAKPVSLHRKQEPPATNFAAIDDVAAVPVNEEGRTHYRQYLTMPAPKAFVVYSTGRTNMYWNDVDAMTKALDNCTNEGKACWLYAVDDRIVWSASEGKRVGLSARLRNK